MKAHQTTLINLLILIFFCTGIYAQEFDNEKMDQLFEAIETNNKGMGSISIFVDGKEVYQNSIGYAGIEADKKANNETKYRIGSITKTFTATIIMKMVEDGQLSLDTKLSDYYPEIKNAEDISIEQLLRHRSGIFNFTNASDYTSWMEQPTTKEVLLQKIINYGSSFTPGEKSSYSNSNYVLLTFIAEDVAGKSYSDLIQEYICEPCALQFTYYGTAINIEKNEAQSYSKLGDWVQSTETNMTVPVGAGAIVSTPTDLNLFFNCLHNHQLVSEASLKEMKQMKEDYGIGMFEMPFYKKIAYGHTGGIDGFNSNASFFPADNVSIAYISNGTDYPVNNILLGALSIYFGKEYELPVFTPSLELTSEELDQYVGVYSSPDFPLDITISKGDGILMAQATGQSQFPLDAYDTHKFRFEAAGIEMEFSPSENEMTFMQGGGQFTLKKE